MKKIDLRDRSNLGRQLLWPVLAVPVGAVILAVAISGQRPLSVAGVLGGLILLAAAASIWLEIRGTRGWQLASDQRQLILVTPRGVRVRLAAAEVGAATRVVRRVDDVASPRLWQAIAGSSRAQDGHSRAPNSGKQQLQSFLQLRPNAGAQWPRRAELAEISSGKDIEIPMDGAVSDRRLRALFTELGIVYHGK